MYIKQVKSHICNMELFSYFVLNCYGHSVDFWIVIKKLWFRNLSLLVKICYTSKSLFLSLFRTISTVDGIGSQPHPLWGFKDLSWCQWRGCLHRWNIGGVLLVDVHVRDRKCPCVDFRLERCLRLVPKSSVSETLLRIVCKPCPSLKIPNRSLRSLSLLCHFLKEETVSYRKSLDEVLVGKSRSGSDTPTDLRVLVCTPVKLTILRSFRWITLLKDDSVKGSLHECTGYHKQTLGTFPRAEQRLGVFETHTKTLLVHKKWKVRWWFMVGLGT